MSEIDIDAFITELERLGVKLSTIRLADGTYRVNRWRTLDASAHAAQIEKLWASHIGDNKRVSDFSPIVCWREPPHPTVVIHKARNDFAVLSTAQDSRFAAHCCSIMESERPAPRVITNAGRLPSGWARRTGVSYPASRHAGRSVRPAARVTQVQCVRRGGSLVRTPF
jgi:hypothetical protein